MKEQVGVFIYFEANEGQPLNVISVCPAHDNQCGFTEISNWRVNERRVVNFINLCGQGKKM